MRVLMAMDPTGWEVPGGHKRQLQKTAEALSQLGVDVRTEPLSEEGLAWADVLHSFGLPSEAIRAARQQQCIVAVSTIYWGASYSTSPPWAAAARSAATTLRFAAHECVRRGRALTGRPVGPLFPDEAYSTALAFEAADVLLPNASGEAAAIARELKVTTPARLVPNAVDPSIFDESTTPGPKDRRGVLCVGRIEPHKNQLALIRALKQTDLELTIVGPPHPHHREYFDTCVLEGGNRVTFVPETSERDLPGLFHRHRVHALPSLFETTGLASLEAALGGCTLVSTDRGHAREYLGGHASYCSPWSSSSIRRAILEAHDALPSSELQQTIRTRFTWSVAGRRTLAAYQGAADESSARR